MSEPDGQDPFSAAAEFLRHQRGAIDRILAAHRAGAGGDCTGCFHIPTRWPCSIAAIALRAQELNWHR